MAIRAVVIGTGWSGEGHTRALQGAGVDVVALCGRSPEPARAKARKLGVQEVRFDWRQALMELRPDIVSIATPAVAHAEIVALAAQCGCHIVCEKPLGLNGEEALAMLRAVGSAGVKHAVGASIRYAPAAAYAHQLLQEEVIGEVRELEAIHHFNSSRLLPYSWFHQLGLGGGALNVDFSAFLGLMLYITGGTLLAVAGEGRCLIDRAPVNGPVHDLRDTFTPLAPELAHACPWQEVTADTGYTVMARLRMPRGNIASALFQGSEPAVGRFPNALTVYGDRGALRLPGYFFPESVELYDPFQQRWTELNIPADVAAARTGVEDPAQDAWYQLFNAFVADVRREAHAEYPTFMDGWLANTVVDIVRSASSWIAVPQAPGIPSEA